MTDKDLYGGLIRLHILQHHAAEEPIFGLGIIFKGATDTTATSSVRAPCIRWCSHLLGRRLSRVPL